MDELLVGLEATNLVELFLDEVFHSLDIVVRHHFDVFDALCILFCEVAIDVAKLLVADRNALQLWQRQMNECDEVLHLNADTITNKSVLREVCR